jgi:hypothetical protein
VKIAGGSSSITRDLNTLNAPIPGTAPISIAYLQIFSIGGTQGIFSSPDNFSPYLDR